MALVMASISLNGQSKYLDAGNSAFERGDYLEAAEQYEKYLAKKFNKQARLRQAEAYRLGMDYPKAVEAYAKVVPLKDIPQDAYLRYAQVLHQTGNSLEAERWFKKHNKRVPGDPTGWRYAEPIERIAEFHKDSSARKATLINSNSDGPDLSPIWYGTSLHLFRATDGKSAGHFHWPTTPQVDFCDASDVNGELSEISTGLGDNLRAQMAYSPTLEMVFFTTLGSPRDKLKSSTIHKETLRIYYANVEDGRWGDMKAMPFNSSTHSAGHPAISADGRSLYFASDMEGGHGGIDIYRSVNQDGFWSEPVNLGPTVNSPGDELFPSFGPSGELYFVSDGHGGLGGLDIFWTRERAGEWSTPVNPGWPSTPPPRWK